MLAKEESFISSKDVRNLVRDTISYKSELNIWKSNPHHRKGTKIETTVKKVEEELIILKDSFLDLLKIKLSKEKIYEHEEHELSKKQQWCSLLTKIITKMISLKRVIYEAKLDLSKINAHRNKIPTENTKEFTIVCTADWDTSFNKLSYNEIPVKAHLSKFQLQNIGKAIWKECFVPTIDVLRSVNVQVPEVPSHKWLKDIVATIVEHFPVLHVSDVAARQSILINIHQLVVGHGVDTFAQLLTMAKDSEETTHQVINDIKVANDEVCDSEHVELLKNTNIRKPGVKPLYMKYPSLCTTLLQFIEQHGFEAQSRRRSEIGTCGCTLQILLDHAKENIPGFSASKEAIRRLMYPRREGNYNISNNPKSNN